MSHKVYTVEHLGQGRGNHVAIFVVPETPDTEDQIGVLYHVTGNILNEMEYERLTSYDISKSYTHIKNADVLIGDVQQADLQRLQTICEAVPVPGKQMRIGGKRIDASKPLRRCTEWVNEAVRDLLAQGVVQSCGSSA